MSTHKFKYTCFKKICMNFKKILFLIYFLVIIILSSTSSFACENIFTCFNEGNYNISEWEGAVQFQFVSLIALIILIIVLLKEDLKNRFNMDGKIANLWAWVMVIALILAVSITQQNDGALRIVFFIATVPLGLLAYVIANKVKGEGKWFVDDIQSSIIGLGLGIYIFIRLVTIFFGDLRALSFLPISILDFVALNFFDLIAVGLVLYFKYFRYQVGNSNSNDYIDPQNSYSKNRNGFPSSNSTPNVANSSRQKPQQEKFPPNNSQKYTKIVDILHLEYDIKRQIYSILSHVQNLKPEDDKKLLKQYLETLIQYFNRFSNEINSQSFSITGEFHHKDDTLDSIISTLNSIIQQFDSIQTEQIRTELVEINKFLETITPSFSNVDSAIAVVIDLGSYIYYINDFNEYLQEFFKILCNNLVQIYPDLRNNMKIINLNTQFQKPNFTFKNSNKELIREFINQL